MTIRATGLLVALLLLVTAGCGSSDDDGGESAAAGQTSAATTDGGSSSGDLMAPEDVTLAYVPIAIANPIVEAMADGARSHAESLGMNYVTIGGEFDVQAQVQAVRAAAQRRVTALGVMPIDASSIQPALDQARDAGISLILQGAPDVKPYLTNLEFNDEAAAYELAQYAAEQVKSSGKRCGVGIIRGIPQLALTLNRSNGLERGARDAGCEILDQQVNDKDTAEGARPIAAGWGVKHGDRMTLILAYNDPSALGAISARTPDFQPEVTGMNGDELGIDAVRAGEMLALMGEPAVEAGAAIAQATYLEHVRGEPVPEELWLRYELITQDNVVDYKTPEDRLANPLTVAFTEADDGKWYVEAR